MAILDDVRKAMFIADDDHEFDSTITDLIASALLDLGIAGANGENVVVSNPLVKTAIVTYCKMHFGESDEYDRLKKSYDEQKAQMATASGYTIWSGCNG
jgi:hypothetical protein